jgi:hypothetical protein
LSRTKVAISGETPPATEGCAGLEVSGEELFSRGGPERPSSGCFARGEKRAPDGSGIVRPAALPSKTDSTGPVKSGPAKPGTGCKVRSPSGAGPSASRINLAFQRIIRRSQATADPFWERESGQDAAGVTLTHETLCWRVSWRRFPWRCRHGKHGRSGPLMSKKVDFPGCNGGRETNVLGF